MEAATVAMPVAPQEEAHSLITIMYLRLYRTQMSATASVALRV